jgi:undecaprenyl-diphosphatase
MSDLMNAAILGVVEGVTEFIPVSSTGHLIVVGALLGHTGEVASVFEIFIQSGAILAIIVLYLQRCLKLAIGFFNNPTERAMCFKILIAFFPAALVGVLTHGFIKEVLFNPMVVAMALIVGGVIMLIVERAAPKPTAQTMDDMTFKTALGIGLCQMAALIPGISRAGASIVGAQFLGVSRRAATEFSFFLAIPTIIGASVFDLSKNIDILTRDDLPVFVVGTIAAFVSALIVVRFFVAYVSRAGFAPFAYYRIIFGSVLLVALILGGIHLD